MELTGIVKLVKDTEVISDKFKKRDLILTTDSDTDYPQFITVQFNQAKVMLLNDLPLGTEVKVSINLRGREWVKDGITNYFNSIEGWRIENTTGAEATANDHSVAKDDLPF